jgi:hypothetical protein
MQLCIYCQKNPKETADHVPPKGIFKKPRPSNLITVPACLKCNSSFSVDDDYFLNIALDWGASESSDGKGVVGRRLSSMRRAEGRNVWRPFFAKLEAVEVCSPGGLFLANSFAFSLDIGRLIRTVNRIIRGLYFDVTKSLLPVGDYTRAMLFSQYVEKNKEDPEAIEPMRFIPGLPGRMIGDATFEFRFCLLDQDSFSSFWYLEFYRRFGFVGKTGGQDGAQTLAELVS